MRGWLAIGVACLWACSPDAPVISDAPRAADAAPTGPDPNDGARSGTRLKLTWFQLADGARQWDGLYDAQRKENCYIYDGWPDGKAYCTPEAIHSIVYANSTCTQRLAEEYRDPSCPTTAPAHVLEWGYTPCDSSPVKLYVRGPKVAVAQYYYKSTSGACNGPYTVSGNWDYYQVGAEIQPSELVEVFLGSPSPGRLSVRFFESPDGMRFQGSVHDAVLGTSCTPRTFDDGSPGACTPSARSVSYEEDAACTVPKLSTSTQCSVPKFGAYYGNNSCPGARPRYFAVGAQVTGTPLYNHNGTSCAAITPSTSSTYYRMGAELELGQVRRTVDTSGQRIQIVRFTSDDGLRFRSYALHDAQKGADCYPTKLPDGTIRCVLFGDYVTSNYYYRDAACAQPVDLVEVTTGSASCSPPVVPTFARKYVTPPSGCGYGTQIYPITSAYTGTVYRNVGTCQAYTPAGFKLYNIGPQVPLTDLVSATITIDP